MASWGHDVVVHVVVVRSTRHGSDEAARMFLIEDSEGPATGSGA